MVTAKHDDAKQVALLGARANLASAAAYLLSAKACLADAGEHESLYEMVGELATSLEHLTEALELSAALPDPPSTTRH